MKKLILILSVVLFASCHSASTEVKCTVDSTKVDSTKAVDSCKCISDSIK